MSEESSKRNLLFTNKELVMLIWPLVIEQSLAVLVGMADTVMVSSVGEAAISGVSLVDMINYLIFTIFAALATGGAVVTSQAIGEKNEKKARKSVGQLVSLAAILGIVVMVGCFFLRSGMLRLFFGRISSEVYDAAMLYFTITLVSYPFLALYNSGAAIFRSMGNSAVSMKVSILMNLINFAGNAFCIFVLRMGVAGVAVPTLFSRIIGAVLILYLATKGDGMVKLEAQNVFSFSPAMVINILKIGIPSAMENSIFQLGRVMVVGMISAFGTVQISANAVANNIDAVGCIFGQAMGLAMISVVGRYIGASDLSGAKQSALKLMKWNYIFQGATNILIILCLNPLLNLYTLTEETRQLAWILIMVHASFAILLWPASFVLPNALRAANDVRFTMCISVFSMVVWRLGFSYLLSVHMKMGAIGVWIAMIIDWVFRVTCFVIRFAKNSWHKYAVGVSKA